MSAPGAGRPLRRLALALGAGTLALLAAEAVARRHEGDTVLVGDGRGYTTRAGTHGSNAAGLHERDLPVGRDPAVRRVVVLGDSMTWGTGTAEEAWPRVAEAALGPPWQAVNLAQYGYDAAQSAAALRVQGWAYAPDRVVYAAYGNDLVPTRLITVGEPPTYAWVGGRGGLLPEPVRRASALLRAVEGAWRARDAEERDDPLAFAAGLADIAAQARAHDVPLLVVGLVPHVLAAPGGPDACDARADGPGRCARELEHASTIERVAREAGLPFGSVLPALRADGGAPWFPEGSADWQHPSPAGQRVYGAAAAAIIAAWEAGRPLPAVDDAPGR